MTHFHAVVWIDHHQARIFHLGLSGVDGDVVHPQQPTHHIHHKANSIGSGHDHLSKDFLTEVAHGLADAGEILIIGPAGAKDELAKFVREHHHAIAGRIVGVEPADHPSDREIIALAKRHFNIQQPRAAAATPSTR
jgi:stalled ribosome rescue protein Dom34